MSATDTEEKSQLPRSIVSGRIASGRLLCGLLQGMALYLLYLAIQKKFWPGETPAVMRPALMLFLIWPPLLISALGHLSPRRIWQWGLVAAVLLVALGYYDFWRLGTDLDAVLASRDDAVVPSIPLLLCAISGFFIAQALILAAMQDHKLIAGYSTYFEVAWKLAIQLKFAALFLSLTWMVLWLGSSLFMLIKIDLLKQLLHEEWFYIPVTSLAFACAFHLTDVRPQIVTGIRSLLLVLMSWLLPLATLIVGGFLLSLFWTGFAPLWATRHASSVLLGAAALLIILINSAYQNGQVGKHVAAPLRISARAAALLLSPIILIAIYSLSLRVLDYGWTNSRIIAAACMLIAALYAIGYARAAASRHDWLRQLAPTNILTSIIIIAVLLALFSPLADPTRLSVASQLQRLQNGKVDATQFDYGYLRFSGHRFGVTALQQLDSAPPPAQAAAVRAGIAAARARKNRWEQNDSDRRAGMTAAVVAGNIQVFPAQRTLPPAFLATPWLDHENSWSLPDCLIRPRQKCEAYLVSLSGNDKEQILLFSAASEPTVFDTGSDGQWQRVGHLPVGRCGEEIKAALRERRYRLLPPALQDMEINGQRLHINPSHDIKLTCKGS